MPNSAIGLVSDQTRLQKLESERNSILNKMTGLTNRAQDIANNYTESRWDDLLGGFKTLDMENTEGMFNANQNRLNQINKEISDIKNRQNAVPEPKEVIVPETKPEPTTKKTSSGGYTKQSRGWTKPAEPTYVDPDGVTHTGMTQDEFNQSMQMYEQENAIYNARNRKIGDKTADEIFQEAIDKFTQDPNQFTDAQKQAIYNAGVSLGYYNETPQQNSAPQPTATTAPTVQPSVTSNAANLGGRTGADVASANDRVMQGGGNSYGMRYL